MMLAAAIVVVSDNGRNANVSVGRDKTAIDAFNLLSTENTAVTHGVGEDHSDAQSRLEQLPLTHVCP